MILDEIDGLPEGIIEEMMIVILNSTLGNPCDEVVFLARACSCLLRRI
jgi:hypothetical protein